MHNSETKETECCNNNIVKINCGKGVMPSVIKNCKGISIWQIRCSPHNYPSRGECLGGLHVVNRTDHLKISASSPDVSVAYYQNWPEF